MADEVVAITVKPEWQAFIKNQVDASPDFGHNDFVPGQILRAVYDALPVSDE